MAAPKVSVLIPTYKYARFLPQTIESVLNQTFADFELIISDDNSNDGSSEIIQRYAARDARIRATVHQKNLGMVENWNWCLAQAKGQYIKYLFGDDFLLSTNALDRLVRMIESQPGIRIAASARTIVDEQSVAVEDWDHIETEGVVKGNKVMLACLRLDRNLIGEPSVVLFRKADGERGFDTSYRQAVDLEFWLHLLDKGGDLAYTRTPLCAFRQHAQQQTAVNRRAVDGIGEHFRILKKYFEHYVRQEHPRQLFERVYWMTKKPKGRADANEIRDLIARELGAIYHVYWLRMRVIKLGVNLRRAWLKHVLGRQFPPKKRHEEDAASSEENRA